MRKKMLEVKILDQDLIFYENGEIKTTPALAEKIKENDGVVLDAEKHIRADLKGWGVFYLFSLIDPDFKLVYHDSFFRAEDIESIRKFVKDYLAKQEDQDSKTEEETTLFTEMEELIETESDENIEYEDLSEYFDDDAFGEIDPTPEKEEEVQTETLTTPTKSVTNVNNFASPFDKLVKLSQKINSVNIRDKNKFIIEPFLRQGLNWPTDDPLYISTKLSDIEETVSYILGYEENSDELFLEDTGKDSIKMIIETTNNVQNEKSKEKLNNYFTALKNRGYGIELAVLTDGYNWEVYTNYSNESKLDEVPLLSFDLETVDEDKIENLSFKQVDSEQIKKTVMHDGYFKNLNTAVQEIFVNNPEQLAMLIIEKVNELSDHPIQTLLSENPSEALEIIETLYPEGLNGLIRKVLD